MPAGRPTKLTLETMEKAIAYINGEYKEVGDMIPSSVGMAVFLDVAEKTLYNWGKASEDFLQILEKCNTRQHNRLVQGGLAGDLNPTICKLVLGKHGYHERKEVTGEDGGAIKSENKVIVTEMSPDEASEIYRSMLGSESQSED